MSPSTNPQRRHWCATVWLPEHAHAADGEIAAREIFESSKKIRYAVGQLESNEELTRVHLQMYFEFHKPMRMSEIKNQLKISSAHLEPRAGSRADARSYCMSKTWKGKSKRRVAGPFERGTWINDIVGSSSERTSHAETAVNCLLQGMLPHQIAAAHPTAFFTHSHKIIQTYEALHTAAAAGIFDYGSVGEPQDGGTTPSEEE